ncbi:EamA family transporter [Aneurinibacillus sp. Ricciae_BoGa-3]|uniref:DMT family transporter n=1 Tax=Aneurinibacillus sp. Ricciae_BoGa-3 TaxID=3022697 RepID=UPI00233FCDF8|nr:EamA family transporter [Aneurinibacillus sp. Ricciae_BoGa-3]WCK54949.1 EamA family transporter [Aneurinibacillus sp. Ricciae_BoGa-3]
MIVGYIVMCLIFGTTFLTIKMGMTGGMPPFFFAGIRFFLAGAIMVVYFRQRGKLKGLTAQQLKDIAGIGLLMTTIPYAALYWGEQYIHSGIAALLVATGPVFTLMLSVGAGQTRFRPHMLSGSALSVVGIGLIVGFSHADEGAYHVVAKLVIVAAEIFYAWGAVRSKKVMAGVVPSVFNGVQMLFASIGLLVMSLLFEDTRHIVWTRLSLAALIYLAIVASIGALGIFYWLIQRTNSTFPSTWTYAAPVIAMIVGAVFLGEKITWTSACGAVCALAGIIVLNLSTLRELLSRNPRRQPKETARMETL